MRMLLIVLLLSIFVKGFEASTSHETTAYYIDDGIIWGSADKSRYRISHTSRGSYSGKMFLRHSTRISAFASTIVFKLERNTGLGSLEISSIDGSASSLFLLDGHVLQLNGENRVFLPYGTHIVLGISRKRNINIEACLTTVARHLSELPFVEIMALDDVLEACASCILAYGNVSPTPSDQWLKPKEEQNSETQDQNASTSQLELKGAENTNEPVMSDDEQEPNSSLSPKETHFPAESSIQLSTSSYFGSSVNGDLDSMMEGGSGFEVSSPPLGSCEEAKDGYNELSGENSCLASDNSSSARILSSSCEPLNSGVETICDQREFVVKEDDLNFEVSNIRFIEPQKEFPTESAQSETTHQIYVPQNQDVKAMLRKHLDDKKQRRISKSHVKASRKPYDRELKFDEPSPVEADGKESNLHAQQIDAAHSPIGKVRTRKISFLDQSKKIKEKCIHIRPVRRNDKHEESSVHPSSRRDDILSIEDDLLSQSEVGPHEIDDILNNFYS